MKRKSDLLYIEPATNKRIAVEIELNYKGKSRTEQNYKNNQRFSDKQIWFIGKRKKVLMNQLEELGADIFYIDDSRSNRLSMKRTIISSCRRLN